MAKENLPNNVSAGIPNVQNLTSEQAEYDRLYSSLTRTQSGVGTFGPSPSSGLSYTTNSYPSDTDVFDKGEEGLLNLFAKYILTDYIFTGDEANDFSEVSDKVNNAFYGDAERYVGSTKLADDGQDVSEWTVGGGLLSQDVSNFRIGDGSIKLETNSASVQNVRSDKESISLDLNRLGNGEVSDDDDYIYLVVYVNNASAVQSIILGFSIDSVYSANNVSYTISSGIVTGWNFFTIKKSLFSISGTGVFSGIQSIRAQWVSNAGFNGEFVSFQLIQLVKSNASLTAPNPFQYVDNSKYEGTITGGQWYVGLENGKNTIKELAGNSDIDALLFENTNYSDFESRLDVTLTESQNDVGTLVWWTDANNYLALGVENSNLRLRKLEGGVLTDSTTPLTLGEGDNVIFRLQKSGSSIIATATKNLEATLYSIASTTTLQTGVLGIGARRISNYNSFGITELEYASKSGNADIANRTLEMSNYENEVSVNGSTISVSKGYDNQRILFTMPSQVSNSTITMIINGISRTLKRYDTDGSIIDADVVIGGLTEVYDDGVNFIYAPKQSGAIKSIQDGTVLVDSGTDTITISAVDLDASYVEAFVYENEDATCSVGETMVGAQLTGSTEITLYVGAYSGTAQPTVYWRVVEYEKSIVRSLQRITSSGVGFNDSYRDATISSVDTNKTIVISSASGSSSPLTSDSVVYSLTAAELSSSTNIRCRCSGTNSDQIDVYTFYLQVVEFY